jgi:molybdopterin biosynthesis enzyme MoaB
MGSDVEPVNPVPVIGGTLAGQAASDEASIVPFAAVLISEPGSSLTITATVTLSATANGVLSNLGTGTYDATTGVYTITGSPSAISNALDALVFTPTAHQVAPGQSVTTSFAITATDAAGATASDTTSSVVASAVSDPPIITGNIGGQALTDRMTVMPFADVTISDPDVGQSETVTVALSSATSGTLSNLATGSYDAASGVYTVSGSDSAVTAALEGLVFTPTPFCNGPSRVNPFRAVILSPVSCFCPGSARRPPPDGV